MATTTRILVINPNGTAADAVVTQAAIGFAIAAVGLGYRQFIGAAPPDKPVIRHGHACPLGRPF